MSVTATPSLEAAVCVVAQVPWLGPRAIVAEKHTVLGLLGRGGFGYVVAAEHLELRERRAIKCLLPEASRDAEPWSASCARRGPRGLVARPSSQPVAQEMGPRGAR